MSSLNRIGKIFARGFYIVSAASIMIVEMSYKRVHRWWGDLIILGIMLAAYIFMSVMSKKLSDYKFAMLQTGIMMLLSVAASYTIGNPWMFFLIMFVSPVFEYGYLNKKIFKDQLLPLSVFLIAVTIFGLPDTAGSVPVIGYLIADFFIFGMYCLCMLAVKDYELVLERFNERDLSLNDMIKIVEEKGDEATKATKAKSAFLASMSHEIRTPINTFIGMNEMILRESKQKNVIGYAEDAKSAADLLLMLVNDILDFSKMESGKMEIVPVKYDIRSMIHDEYVMFSAKIEEKGIRFICKIDPNIPSRLVGDDVRIKQILTNLISNAMKYTNMGEIIFSINVLYIDDKICVLEYKVKDTGTGIKPEDMDKLFTAFKRIGENTQNRYIQGTGLGITITCNLLKLMGSELRVKSEYGKGSEFSFVLEQSIVDKEKIGSFNEIIHAAPIKDKIYSSLKAKDVRLLVVDDNPMNISVFKNYVKDDGITVDKAESGYTCCDMVRKNVYDLIFMDHMMPGMDGVETLKTLLSMHDNLSIHTPVIMLTATATAHIKEQFLSQGFADYLSKPIDSSKLIKKIAEFLPDKVKIQTSELTAPKEDETPAELPMVDGMDVKFARSHFADTEQLIESITMFIGMSDTEAISLGQFYEDNVLNGDFTDYRVKVHSMKSSAAVIGMIPLAGMAKILENAAAEEDLATIKAMHRIFIKKWGEYTDLLRVFETDDDVKKMPASENVQTIETLLSCLKRSAENIELDALDELMDALDGYSYSGADEEFMKKLKGAVNQFDTDEIINLVDKYFDLKEEISKLT